MTTPLWCLTIVVFIPIILAFIGSYFKTQQFGTLDNKNPREQAVELSGAGSRANAAQSNAWEALAMFTVAVLVSHLAGVPAEEAAPWTIAFVVARLLHAIFYISDLDKARSVSFLAGIVCIVTLFVKAA